MANQKNNFNPDLGKMLGDLSSRYSLVIGTAKRARDIRDEAVNNGVLLDEQPVTTAINEIESKKYEISEPDALKKR